MLIILPLPSHLQYCPVLATLKSKVTDLTHCCFQQTKRRKSVSHDTLSHTLNFGVVSPGVFVNQSNTCTRYDIVKLESSKPSAMAHSFVSYVPDSSKAAPTWFEAELGDIDIPSCCQLR